MLQGIKPPNHRVNIMDTAHSDELTPMPEPQGQPNYGERAQPAQVVGDKDMTRPPQQRQAQAQVR